MRRLNLLLALLLFGPSHAAHGDEPAPASLQFDFSGKGTQAVALAAADGKRAVAIDVGSVSGSARLKAPPVRLEAGRYRVTVFARLHHKPADDLSRLAVQFVVSGAEGSSGRKRVVWTQFDSAPRRLTPITWEATFAAGFAPTLEVSWQQVAASATQRARPIRPVEPPAAPNVTAKTEKPKPLLAEDDLLSELENEEQAPALTSVGYPAVVIDRAVFEPISRAQVVSRVFPRFVHVYPGGENPIDVDVRNFADRAVEATVKLEIVGGLDEVLDTQTQAVELPAGGKASCRFEWSAGMREFGHEARATLLVDDRPVPFARELWLPLIWFLIR